MAGDVQPVCMVCGCYRGKCQCMSQVVNQVYMETLKQKDDLLAALEGLYSSVDIPYEELLLAHLDEDWTDISNNLKKAKDTAREAIRKAKGECDA